MKKFYVLAIAIIFGLSLNAQVFQDSFDTYDDFIIDNIGTWTMIDNDGGTSYGAQSFDFTNEGYVGSFIVFNSTTTAPVATDWEAHTGNKCLVIFDSGASGTTTPNDDWIISEEFTADATSEVSLWIESITDSYGLERYNIYLMDGTTDADIVEKLNSGASYDEAALDWNELTYDISSHAGETLRLGIQCVSDDAFAMLIDDISISGETVATTYNTTFNVDMTDSIASGYFDPATDNLFVTGSFIGWKTPGDSIPAQQLLDVDGDSIYTLVRVDTVGSYQYKYFKNAGWDNGEWNGDPNRTYSVVDADVTLSDVFGEVPTTAINELNANALVGPNPTNGVLFINADENYNVEVLDMTGRIVISTEMQNNKAEIDLTAQQAGLYIVRLSNENGATSYKVVKK